MSREHPEVRLNRTPFGERWEVVRLAKDGLTITDRWPLDPTDAATLEETLGDKHEAEHAEGAPCPAVLNIAGEHFACDWMSQMAPGSHDHQGWAHTNQEAGAIWSSDPKVDGLPARES